VSEHILALIFGTPINLSNNLPSNLGDIYRTSPVLALGILHILGDVNLGPEKSGLDQEVSLESGVHDGHSGGVARQPKETKGGIHRGICETDVERGVARECVYQEFAAGVVFGVREEGDVSVNGTVRSFDEELGESSKIILFVFVTRKVLDGVILEGDVDGDGRVPSLENQEFSGGEISDDGVILSPDVTTVNG